MPQLSRLCTISGDEKVLKILDSIPVQISPALGGASLFDFGRSNNGVLVITSGTAYNITPNVTFTANVVMWGGGGNAGPAIGGGGGFSSAVIRFNAGVSYNVAAGSAGGGGSGIEYLANANPILIAGGGGNGGSAAGGAGGGIIAANGTGSGATAYGAASPGIYRTGGPGTGAAFGMGYGGTGTGAGGGGMYGGALNAAGGGGGSGWISPSIDLPNGNTITGSGSSAANPSHPLRGNFGDAANNGLVIITLLNT